MTQQDQDNITEEEIIENLKFQGQKLAVLLHKSTMSEDIKEAWIALLPKMSIDQISNLLEILESKYLNENKELDEAFKKQLEEMIEKYKTEDKEIEDQFIQKINKVCQE